MNIIKFLCGTWWGSDPETLVIFYKSYIRSIIDYCSYIYCPRKVNLLEKIQKIQNSGIRIALGYRISTPINVMHAESKIVPLIHRTKYLCDNYLAKVMSNTGSLSHKCVKKYHSRYMKKPPKKARILSQSICDIMEIENQIMKNEKYNSYCYDYDAITANVSINFDLGKKIKDSADPDGVLNQFLENNNVCPLFTDGSKSYSSEAVGSSVHCPSLSLNIKNSHSKQMSVFSSECAAIAKALEIIFENNLSNAAIFSDSLSALQCLASKISTAKTNPFIFLCKIRFHQITSRNPEHSPRFYWLPAHIGIQGNEQADSLAKLASLNKDLTSTVVPFTDLKESFKRNMLNNSKDSLLSQGLLKGKKYFETFYRDSKYPWYHDSRYSRACIVTINRCRADHYGLAESLHRLGIINDAQCKCGHPSQDINHVLWQCLLYEEERDEFIEKLRKVKVFLPCSADTLLFSPHSSACQLMVDFLDKCKLNV